MGLVLLLAGPAYAAGMTAVPAMDGIFNAFQTHPLVGIGEHHRIQQELDFYAALISDPRFAREVGNVVVEFGGAVHQDIIDRYVNGDDVPYTELRKVWTDTVGWIPVVPALGYPVFFAQVRQVNKSLPPGQHIHVWLGDPPIDWSKVKTHAEWQTLNSRRDIFPAALIEKQILARGRKALVIYGGGHFMPPAPGSAGDKMEEAGWHNTTWADIIRRDHPGSLYTIFPYGGMGDKSCAQDIESLMAGWPVPALATPIKGSDIAAKQRACDKTTIQDGSFPPGMTNVEKEQVLETMKNGPSLVGDAMLYLGPSGSLTFSPYIPDMYLDIDYAKTLARHNLLQTGEELPDYPIKDYAAISQKVHP
ncbi:MAG: hypothetical protein J0G99_12510 [Alphaproteobacteria bacterium]|nr:hypothetical protein [Alphaproteobacteria bacterium]